MARVAWPSRNTSPNLGDKPTKLAVAPPDAHVTRHRSQMAQEYEPQNRHRAHLEGLLDRLREVAQSLLRGGPEAALRPCLERRIAAHRGRVDVRRMPLLQAFEEVQGDGGRGGGPPRPAKHGGPPAAPPFSTGAT